MKQVVNKAASGDIKHIKLALEHMGALDERERVTHREGYTAEERLNRKLDQMHERLLAGRPLFDDAEEK
jgi:hypothetical protein